MKKENKAEFMNSVRNDYLRCVKIIESCKTIEQAETVYKWLKRVRYDRWIFYAEQVCDKSEFAFRLHYLAELMNLYDEVDIIYKDLVEKYFQKRNEILGIQ